MRKVLVSAMIAIGVWGGGAAMAGDVCIDSPLAGCPNPATVPVPGAHGTITAHPTKVFVEGGTDDGTVDLGQTGVSIGLGVPTGVNIKVDGNNTANTSSSTNGTTTTNSICLSGSCSTINVHHVPTAVQVSGNVGSTTLGSTGIALGPDPVVVVLVNGSRFCTGANPVRVLQPC